MSILKASPAPEVPHVEIHNAGDGYLVDDISLGLSGGVDGEDTSVLLVEGGTLHTTVRFAAPALWGSQCCVKGDWNYEQSYPASARWSESRRTSCH